MIPEKTDLLLCDYCLRSEVAPVIEDPTAELLSVEYEEDSGCWVCEDCRKKGDA